MKKKQEKSLEESNAMVLETWTIDKAVNALTKNNPRIITTKQLTDLRAGIKQFGLLLPPIVNKQTGNVVGGHQRIRAAQLLVVVFYWSKKLQIKIVPSLRFLVSCTGSVKKQWG